MAAGRPLQYFAGFQMLFCPDEKRTTGINILLARETAMVYERTAGTVSRRVGNGVDAATLRRVYWLP